MKRKKQPTRYGRLVMARMAERNIPLKGLSEEVERRTGRFCTEHFIYGHLCGIPAPWWLNRAIRDILELHKKPD